jgi:phosphomannomutase
MAFIKSISGFRGTIGGKPGDNLTPLDIVECTASYGKWLIATTGNPKVVVGRDGRISGEMVSALAVNTLRAMGISVIDLGLSTTPTVEMAVPMEKAGGGIIFTASHNPREWNALKLLNQNGEFISAADGTQILQIAAEKSFEFASVDKLGSYQKDDSYIQKHIDAILELPLVNIEAVREKGYKVVIDAVNSTGALALPPLLEALGCQVIIINSEITGNFAHNPEPLKENLSELSHQVKFNRAHLGIAVDPDVDRLVFVCEDGELFGEEYTLVAVADYILSKMPGNTVSNMSSTRALRDVTEKYGRNYYASSVGEVHVVAKMKEVKAVIGGEGNGGIILPQLHYGRDALVGIALFLTHLANFGKSISMLRRKYPSYQMAKNKIELSEDLNLETIFKRLGEKYAKEQINVEDGLKIDWPDCWVHLRPSNTEPIIRIYSEAPSQVTADALAKKIISDVNEIRWEKGGAG